MQKQKQNHKHILNLLNDEKMKREDKVIALDNIFTEGKLFPHIKEDKRKLFPPIEGDKVTFIGSTFLRNGEAKPYLNHCIVLDTCDIPQDVENCKIETYATEEEVLLAWQRLIQRENPDIITGYNIFGFDYEFMVNRAEENELQGQFYEIIQK